MGFTLKEVVSWGRSFEEYVRMFHLSKSDLRKKIVSCADGPSSFNCGMKQRGNAVISFDPLYRSGAEEIRSQIDRIYPEVKKQLELNKEHFVWTTFTSSEDLCSSRLKAMEDFLGDFEAGKKEGRYVVDSFPDTNFHDGQFDLAVCSHFLFLYSSQLSFDFHLRSVLEMCRVAREVRIFPLLNIDASESPHIKPLIAELPKDRFKVSIPKVDYEIQRGGNRMLKITYQ
jgi:hypothetical protein